MAHPYLANLEKLLWPAGARRGLWMIVDGARDRQIFGMLLNSYLEYSCLYSGTIPVALEPAAPYLVQLEYEDRYTRQLLERGWGKSWGIVLKCDTSVERLRRHLRTFLVVQDPRGKQLLFRYYDPRVWRVYLPTCNDSELRTVFGPIEAFYVEDEDPAELWEFRREDGRLARRKISLATGEVAVPRG
ncbi:MAG TPA: DUF4123 domain-containing protein [Bryobacteraceae bacterium]|nr:DUF4123 domain-containing protein [Bryobacteraceae bacterium]